MNTAPSTPRIFFASIAALLATLSAAAAAEPRIIAIQPSQTSVPQYGCFEARIDLDADYKNGFDSAQVQVSGQFQGPTGNIYVVGGFLFQECVRSLVDGIEHVSLKGAPQ